jgi:hypothetical protein
LIVHHCIEQFSPRKGLFLNCLQIPTRAIPNALYERGGKRMEATSGKLLGGIMEIKLLLDLVLRSPSGIKGKALNSDPIISIMNQIISS